MRVASLEDAAGLSPTALAALWGALDQQREAEADTERFFQLDEEFHQLLLDAGGHANAWRTVVSAKAHLDRARRLGMRMVSPVSSLIDQHTAIVDALAAGDLGASISAMRAHLRLVFADVERIRSHSPELFVTDSGQRPVRKTVTAWA